MATSETLTREDLKNVLDKVLPLKSGDVKFSSVTSIDLNNTWTAPKDGFVYVGVGWNNNASYGYCYIKDYTTGAWAGLISNANSLGGFSESTMFPVVEGHQYKVDMSNQVGSVTAVYYPLVGGFDAIASSVDYVVEEGTDGIWTYRKWASGIAECWGQYYMSIPSMTAWGSCYYSPYVTINYPSGLFTVDPSVSITRTGGLEGWAGCQTTNVNSVVGAYLLRPATGSGTTVLAISAKGGWK